MFLQASVILLTGRGVPDTPRTWSRHTTPPPTWSRHPPTRYIPPKQTPPGTRCTPPTQSMLGDTVNERAVRILLECNLVSQNCPWVMGTNDIRLVLWQDQNVVHFITTASSWENTLSEKVSFIPNRVFLWIRYQSLPFTYCIQKIGKQSDL